MSFETAIPSSPKKTASPAGVVQLNTAQSFLRENQAKPDHNFWLQPKLTVGAPDDPYEKEADAVADKVMRMTEPNYIQRKCVHCEKEEKISRKPLAHSTVPFIQT